MAGDCEGLVVASSTGSKLKCKSSMKLIHQRQPRLSYIQYAANIKSEKEKQM